MTTVEEPAWPWLNIFEPFPALSGYRPVIGRRGMVSSPHFMASAIGVEILKDGGNAVDAAIATSAALMVTCPMQCGPGGDAFWVVADGRGDIAVLDASGPAPAAANLGELSDQGVTAIPKRSGYAVTVPGAIDGWAKAHRRFGSLSLDRLIEPAAKLAEQGFPASRHTRASFLICESEMRAKDALALFGGRVPELYALVRQPRLAATLRAIGRTQGRVLYEGDLARAVAAACRTWGGWLSEDDLASYSARWEAPVSTGFRSMMVHTAPPTSQGFALLAALRAVQSVSAGPLDPFDPSTTHLLLEAIDAALGLRDRINGAEAHALLEAAMREMDSFGAEFDAHSRRDREFSASGSRKGDTANLVAVDAAGMAVSLTQSMFYDFGTCIPVPEGGFTLHNRGAAFSLGEGHPAQLAAGRHPPHTLMPTIVTEAGKVRYALGCMGGDGQVQTQLKLLVDLIDGGLDPQQAISRPRWYLERGTNNRIVAEAGAVDAAGLVSMGHQVSVLQRFEEIVGHAQAIEVTRGTLVGAADPRSDGLALPL